MKKYQVFNLGNIKLLSGQILKSAKLVYKTYGNLNKDFSNAVILPTFYTGTHVRNEGFIGKNRALNPIAANHIIIKACFEILLIF